MQEEQEKLYAEDVAELDKQQGQIAATLFHPGTCEERGLQLSQEEKEEKEEQVQVVDDQQDEMAQDPETGALGCLDYSGQGIQR